MGLLDRERQNSRGVAARITCQAARPSPSPCASSLTANLSRCGNPFSSVISDDAQGEGLGRAAWQVMRAATPRLFWRSRANNPINEFYFAEADGCLKGEQWNVFWYGLESFEEIRFAVDHCRARPASLKD